MPVGRHTASTPSGAPRAGTGYADPREQRDAAGATWTVAEEDAAWRL